MKFSISTPLNAAGETPGISRIFYYDILNVVATFGVVSMHFNGLTHSYSNTFAWKQALFIDCIFYWAVPIFFMLTGATLLGYRSKYDTRTFLRKRLIRTFIPFITWSCIALIWKIATNQMPAPVGPRSTISLILNTQIIDVYWFFIPLFGIYLSIPLLSLLTDRKRELWFTVIVAFALNVFAPSVMKAVGINLNSSLSLPVLGGYLIYVVLGYLLKDCYISSKARIALYLCGIAGVAVRYFGTVICSINENQLVQSTWGYTNIPCFFESIAVFVLVKNINWNHLIPNVAVRQLITKLSSCSFGVYLIHMIVFWYGLLLTGLNGGDLIWRTAGPIVAYVVCIFIVTLFKRIPFIRRLLP